MNRRGFTMIEMLIALCIAVFVFAELSVTLFGVFRFMRDKSAEAEFSLRFREIRERTLFRCDAATDAVAYGGLLSATNIWTSGTSVSYPCVQAGQAVEYVEHDFNPAGNPVQHRRFAAAIGDEDGAAVDGTANLRYLTATVTLPIDGTTVTRSERMVLPIFGTPQAYLNYGVDQKKE